MNANDQNKSVQPTVSAVRNQPTIQKQADQQQRQPERQTDRPHDPKTEGAAQAPAKHGTEDAKS